MVSALIDPKKKEAVRRALATGDISGVLAPRKNDVHTVSPAIETPKSSSSVKSKIELDHMLLEASKKGNTGEVERLLKAGAGVEAQSGEHGRTALMHAAENGHIDVVKLLINAGADVNASFDYEDYGRSALKSAARNGHAEIARVLIGAGAKVDDEAANLKTALMHAAENGHAEIAKLLIEAGADVNALFKCDGFWNLSLTVLMHAVIGGNTEIVKLLVEAGAKVNVKNKKGKTALMLAEDEGRGEIAGLLRKHSKWRPFPWQ